MFVKPIPIHIIGIGYTDLADYRLIPTQKNTLINIVQKSTNISTITILLLFAGCKGRQFGIILTMFQTTKLTINKYGTDWSQQPFVWAEIMDNIILMQVLLGEMIIEKYKTTLLYLVPSILPVSENAREVLLLKNYRFSSDKKKNSPHHVLTTYCLWCDWSLWFLA